MNRTSKVASILVGISASIVSIAAHADELRHNADASATARSTNSAPASQLDLKAPQITRIFTAQQIDMVLASAVDPELEGVEVEASRIGDLPQKDRSASAPEVAFKEVVRWFAPYPSTLAAQVNAAPDFTAPYRPVPVSLADYHAGMIRPYSQR